MSNVAIVIVSHSIQIAEGTAQMARQMVGDDVVLTPCGGDVDGELGTNVAEIKRAIEGSYSEKGVLVIVDLGGAETNTEVAIEMLGDKLKRNVKLADAAIVEGTLMAATEAASGAGLDEVKKTAEDYR